MGGCASITSKFNSQKEFATTDSYDYGLRAMIGERRSMEDRNTICLALPKHPSYSLFGIFDGFNGSDAASYFSSNIVHLLDELTDIENDEEIIQSINKMDALFCKKDEMKSETYNANSGTTFVFALVKRPKNVSNKSEVPLITSKQRIQSTTNTNTNTTSTIEAGLGYDSGAEVRVFWAGDSRAMVIDSRWKYVNLTIDHHCDVDAEAKRIRNANGEIINNRLDGRCAISRCFGCDVMKTNELLAREEQKMISDAECKKIICYENDTLLLFCDGLIEKWDEKQLVTNYKCHYNYQSSLLFTLEDLCDQAINDGSTDNVTAIAVKFK